jgi:hypothetical protein
MITIALDTWREKIDQPNGNLSPRFELGLLMDRIHERWRARDLCGLRQAGAELLAALNALTPARTPDQDDEAAFVCRAIEHSLGLPPGTLELWPPHQCSEFCRCHVGSEQPRRGAGAA